MCNPIIHVDCYFEIGKCIIENAGITDLRYRLHIQVTFTQRIIPKIHVRMCEPIMCANSYVEIRKSRKFRNFEMLLT